MPSRKLKDFLPKTAFLVVLRPEGSYFPGFALLCEAFARVSSLPARPSEPGAVPPPAGPWATSLLPLSGLHHGTEDAALAFLLVASRGQGPRGTHHYGLIAQERTRLNLDTNEC